MSISTTRAGTTTAFIIDGRDYFASHLDNGGARVGMVGGQAFDFPVAHPTFAEVVALKSEEEAEALFDACCALYL